MDTTSKTGLQNPEKAKKNKKKYDIFSSTEPEMPNLKASGLEIVRDSLTQISPEMHPSVASSMWSPLANHLTEVYFLYPSNEWLEITGLINHLVPAKQRNGTPLSTGLCLTGKCLSPT